MPSLWELLCFSRQRYSTHDTAKTPPHSRLVETRASYEQSEVDYYIQPDHHSGPPEPTHSPRESSARPWGVSDRRGYGQGQERPTNPSAKPSPPLSMSPRENNNRLGLQTLDTGLIDMSTADRRFNDSKPRRTPRPVSEEASDQGRRRSDVRRSGEQRRTQGRATNEGKRRHVQDIFLDNSAYQDNQTMTSRSSLNMSSGSVQTASSYTSADRGHRPKTNAAGKPGQTDNVREDRYITRPCTHQDRVLHERHSTKPPYGMQKNIEQNPKSPRKQSDSMYQYSPRAFDDNAISAALFGNRIDDFVHDPSWNRAMERFAASPTSTGTPTSPNSSFTFGEIPPSSTGSSFSSRPRYESYYHCNSSHNQHSGQEWPASSRRVVAASSEGSGGNLMYTLPAEDLPTTSGPASATSTQEAAPRTVDRSFDSQPLGNAGSRGSGIDIEQLFSSAGDVLY